MWRASVCEPYISVATHQNVERKRKRKKFKLAWKYSSAYIVDFCKEYSRKSAHTHSHSMEIVNIYIHHRHCAPSFDINQAVGKEKMRGRSREWMYWSLFRCLFSSSIHLNIIFQFAVRYFSATVSPSCALQLSSLFQPNVIRSLQLRTANTNSSLVYACTSASCKYGYFFMTQWIMQFNLSLFFQNILPSFPFRASPPSPTTPILLTMITILCVCRGNSGDDG